MIFLEPIFPIPGLIGSVVLIACSPPRADRGVASVRLGCARLTPWICHGGSLFRSCPRSSAGGAGLRGRRSATQVVRRTRRGLSLFEACCYSCPDHSRLTLANAFGRKDSQLRAS